jgi:hypothetical protein
LRIVARTPALLGVGANAGGVILGGIGCGKFA